MKNPKVSDIVVLNDSPDATFYVVTQIIPPFQVEIMEADHPKPVRPQIVDRSLLLAPTKEQLER